MNYTNVMLTWVEEEMGICVILIFAEFEMLYYLSQVISGILLPGVYQTL
jgi:hypothetical protein